MPIFSPLEDIHQFALNVVNQAIRQIETAALEVIDAALYGFLCQNRLEIIKSAITGYVINGATIHMLTTGQQKVLVNLFLRLQHGLQRRA